MMGISMPETCWALSKGQVIDLWSCCILLVDSVEKATVAQLLNIFQEFYGTRRFITVFTRVPHMYLSWAVRVQSTATHSLCSRPILISPRVPVDIVSGPFSSGFPTVSLSTCFLPYRYRMPRKSGPQIWLGKWYLARGTNMNLHFSRTLTPCSSLNMRYQVSHSYKTTGKSIQ
jgi:hypothetical protein